jgi:hypothetical protein
MRITAPNERKPWTCEVCGRVDAWGPDWRHYGSVKFDEECGHMVITCSKACRETDRAAALILAYERSHSYTCKAGA